MGLVLRDFQEEAVTTLVRAASAWITAIANNEPPKSGARP